MFALQIGIVAAVVVFSLRRAILMLAALVRPRPLPSAADVPSVSVVVPAWNEGAVIDSALGALDRLRYPNDRMRFVMVSDGSSDDTAERLRNWASARSDTRVLVLPERCGKAAALNAALQMVETELVVVLDADLRPHPDFLAHLTRPFADARIGAAAAFLNPANATATLVSRYAAVTTWVHQLVTSAGTDRLGLNPPTLGAAAYRRTALDAIGGFPRVPVGVDVATSARLIRGGWRTRFVADAVADNVVVSRARDWWRQHVRWTRAAFRVSRAGVEHVAHHPRTSWPQRLEMALAAIGNGDRLAFALAAAAAVPRIVPVWVPLLYLTLPGLEIGAALWKAGVVRALPSFLGATVLFFGVDLIGSVAAVGIHSARRPYRWYNPRQNRDAHRQPHVAPASPNDANLERLPTADAGSVTGNPPR